VVVLLLLALMLVCPRPVQLLYIQGLEGRGLLQNQQLQQWHARVVVLAVVLAAAVVQVRVWGSRAQRLVPACWPRT
jgi:hypothetical protein